MRVFSDENVVAFPGRSGTNAPPDLGTAVPFDPEKPISVPDACMRIIEWPGVSAFQVYLDRIPPHDVHAMRFFQNLTASGFVSVFSENVAYFWDDAVLSVTEPEDGESFSIPLSDFIRFSHPSGELEDPKERETFFLGILELLGLDVEFCQNREAPKRSNFQLTEETLAVFFPEAIPIIGGSESGGFTQVILSGKKVSEEMLMEITPEGFKDPKTANLLQLLLWLEDDLKWNGEALPEDSNLVCMRSSGDSIVIPVRFLRSMKLLAIDRLHPILRNVKDEDERLDRFFDSYVSSQIVNDSVQIPNPFEPPKPPESPARIFDFSPGRSK